MLSFEEHHAHIHAILLDSAKWLNVCLTLWEEDYVCVWL